VRVVFDPRMGRPLPTGLTGVCCGLCDRPLARWEFPVEEGDGRFFSCAPCFLYASLWGKDNPEEVARLAAHVESSLGRPLQRQGDRVVGEDADRLVYGIVMAAGAVALLRRRKAADA